MLNTWMNMSPNWRVFFVLLFYVAIFMLIDLCPDYRMSIFLVASIIVSLYISYVARFMIFQRAQVKKMVVIDRNGKRMVISTL